MKHEHQKTEGSAWTFAAMLLVRGIFWFFGIFVAVVLMFTSWGLLSSPTLFFRSSDGLMFFGASLLYFAVGIVVMRVYFGSVRRMVARRRDQLFAEHDIEPDFSVEEAPLNTAYLGFDTKKRIAVCVGPFQASRIIPFDDFISIEVEPEKGGKRLFKFVLRNGTESFRVGPSKAWEFRGRVFNALGFQ